MSDFDCIVVGSGAAGAAAAWRLASKGFKVACLDRGPWMDPGSYPSTRADWEVLKRGPMSPVSATRGAPQDYPVDDSRSPIAVCNFNAIGGSTILYSAHFPRFRPTDFRLHSDEGLAVDWPISYADLQPYFAINERMMSVSGLAGDPCYPDIEELLPPVPLGEVGTRLAHAFNEKGWHWWPSYAAISTRDRNGRAACLNLGPCNTGCPQGAKSSTDITYLADAKKYGLEILDNTSVSEIVVEDARIAGVRVVQEGKSRKTLRSDRVILAASAIGTPRILLNSRCDTFPNGVANGNDLVGRNLMIHPLGYAEGVFPDPMDTDIGPQGCMLYSLEHYRSPDAGHRLGYMLHALRGAGPLESALSAYGRRKLKFGEQLYDDFESFHRKQVVLSVICEDLPDPANRVELDAGNLDANGDPGVKVTYSLSDNCKKMMTHGMGKAREVLMAAGARRVYAHGPVRNTGWHVMGTTPMGRDPNSSVVDTTGQAHGIDGLYIVDSSVFVTSSCVNPANTIQAVALYIADAIAEIAKHETRRAS
ncbi:MAG: GMC family oxidoreductase [Pseudomonadota bacterium]